MEILIITILILAATLLFLAELFIFPGVSLAGFAALGCMLYANFKAYTELGMTAGLVTSVASALACIGSLVWFMRSKTLDKLSLKENVAATLDTSDKDSLHVGDLGLTTTRLALMGHADFDGRVVEVKSIDGFIDEKTRVRIERIVDGVILVVKKPC